MMRKCLANGTLLGREYHIPGPTLRIVLGPWLNKNQRKCSLIVEMLEHMKLIQVLVAQSYGNGTICIPKNWYGPPGIGTGRGISGLDIGIKFHFEWMPDWKFVEEIVYHFFGDDDYAAVTGWPNMIQTLSDDGWMGIAPSGKRINMCSLDFWRIEDGLIRENWVLVDLLDVYHQLGVDVLARMREFTKCRNLTID